MTEAKHTPGPWVYDGNRLVGSNGHQVVIKANGMAFGSASSWPEAEANSDLCIAAPDMLEALIALGAVLDFDFEAPPCGCFDDASALNAAMAKGRAAIAKARGG